MKEYSKEERKEIINRINKMQRAVFRFRKENGREPNTDELSNILNESLKKIIEIKDILLELEKEDKKIKFEPMHHTKEDIEKAREIRKNKKIVNNIKKYMKGE